MTTSTCYNIGLNSYQKWNIGNIVRALLIEEPAIKEQIGLNIYPLIAPENVYGDFIIYRRHEYSKNSVKNGVYEDVCKLAIQAISDNYDNSILLASNIDNTLTGKHKLDDGTKVSIMLNDSEEQFIDGKYVQIMIFEIK